MVRVFLLLFLLFLTAFSEEKDIKIISNYPLPKNNIKEIYQKTKDINLIVDYLKKTGDFEKIYYKDGKLFLKRKLRLKKITVTGNRSFWKREILAITGLVESYPVDTRILHNIYTRLKKFYMDNGFPFVDVYIDAKVDPKGEADLFLKINEGKKTRIGKVIIHSSKKIEKNLYDKIIKASGIKKGDLFRLSEITNSVDKIQTFLQDKNYFDSFVNLISFIPSGKNVDVVIFIDFGKEYRLHFTGNKTFSKKQLEKLLTLKENGFNYYQLVESTQNIENFYRDNGFLDVVVIPNFAEDYKNMKTDIFFTIFEGKRYIIKEIVVETDLNLLKEKLEKLKGSYFKEKQIKEILQKKSEELYSKGFLNVSYSIDKKIDKKEKTVALSIKFFKGQKFVLRSVNVNKLKIEYSGDLPEDYSPEKILSFLDSVKKKLKDEGYLDGDAYLDVEFTRMKGYIYVDINIKVKTGKRYRNGLTFIYGTRHLNPEVISKNITKKEFFTKEDFDNELDYLYYSSLFDSVNPYLEIDKKNKKVNKLYILHEDKRGSFQGILGYSSEQKLKISTAVRLKNLFSYGFELSGYIERTDLGFFYKLTAGNRMLPKRTSAELSFLRSYQYHNIYELENKGFEMIVSKKPNKWVKQILSVHYMDNSLKNQKVYPKDNFQTLKLRLSFIDNHRKPEVNPKKGYFLSGLIEKEFKDIDFYKVYATGRYYKSFLFFTFTQKLSLGYIFKKIEKLPPSERFFLGGMSSLRGFSYEAVSGRYKEGGNSSVLLNSEIRYPLFPSYNLFGFSFIDAGNVYESFSQLKKLNMRKTAGTGIYIPTPVGSFLFDVAFKLDRKKGESLYRFEFSINTLF
ncbi:BamA/OMP85 family outer membrane protein [Persephonella sp.]